MPGYFAKPFYLNYTIPSVPPVAPEVTILSATPNPLTSGDTELDLEFVCTADAEWVVALNDVLIDGGTLVGGVTVQVLIAKSAMVVGLNTVTVYVANENGADFAGVDVTVGEDIIPRLCWGGFNLDDLPREEWHADPLANRLSRHIAQPHRAEDVFILASGAVVKYWTTPEDPIRIALWGAAAEQQHLSEADAQILIDAGFGAGLVVCGTPGGFGFGEGGFGEGGFGGGG